MKWIIRGALFNLCCVFVFAICYWNLESHFIMRDNKRPELLDQFFLATTIQAGVGYTDLYPITPFAKVVLIIQQLIMILANLFILYFFTRR